MTPALLLPGALAALLALIVPLVIHIARRSEQVPTDFAAFTATSPICRRSSGFKIGDGVSSITFWWRRCTLHSRSFR